MRHGKKFNKLGRTAAHRKSLLKNLAMSLFEHGYIATTVAKAKALKPFAEKIITQAIKAQKAETIAQRIAVSRQIERKIQQYHIYLKLINVWAVICLNRPGGYLRIIKIQNRRGDNAGMAYIGVVIDPRYIDTIKSPDTALKSLFLNLSEHLINDHLPNKNLLTQWYHFKMPEVVMESTISVDQRTRNIKFKILFPDVNLNEAGWPRYNNRKPVDLPISLHINNNLPENSTIDYRVLPNDEIKIIPSYNEKSTIKILIPPLEEAQIIQGEISVKSNTKDPVQKLDYCYLTISGPIGDIYIYNFLKKNNTKNG